MNKKLKLFLKVAYYIFTFGLGILLAITLPGIYTYDSLAKTMNSSLEDGNYSNAMRLIGGYYDSEYAYIDRFSDESGIVIFRAATLFDAPEDINQSYQIQVVYAGFLYNVKDKYNVSSSDNKTHLEVYDSFDTVYSIDLLNYDTDGDEKLDAISTLVDYSYVYFEVPKNLTDTITKLCFYDASGSVFKEIDLDLNFDNLFFTSLEPFINAYNTNSASEELNTLDQEFRSQSDNYLMGNYSDIQSDAVKEATIVVLIYFVWVYILGDLLVGKRYILRFIIFIYHKIRKTDLEVNTAEVYGTDYYTKLTFKLMNADEFDKIIKISYHNENDEIEFILTKDNNYELTKRIHAGIYLNAKAETEGYYINNLPLRLEVKGYQMTVEIKAEKK